MATVTRLERIAEGAVFGGVELSSRYREPHELRLMARVVLRMPPWARQAVASIWCNSKATCCYSVVMKPGFNDPETIRLVGGVLSRLLHALNGGHNDICIGESYCIGGDWDEPA